MLITSLEPGTFEIFKCNPWDMPTNYAQNSAFICANGDAFFTSTTTSPYPVSEGIIELVPS